VPVAASAWKEITFWPPLSVTRNFNPLLASLGDGYQLICGRLQRMLSEHRIERLACAGQSVDPAQMRVIELVDAPGVPPETVVEEIRPGYAWRGRVVRYAEVRATRAAPQHPDDEDVEPADMEPADDMEPAEDADWDDPFDRNEAVDEEELWQGKDARYGNDRRD